MEILCGRGKTSVFSKIKLLECLTSLSVGTMNTTTGLVQYPCVGTMNTTTGVVQYLYDGTMNTNTGPAQYHCDGTMNTTTGLA